MENKTSKEQLIRRAIALKSNVKGLYSIVLKDNSNMDEFLFEMSVQSKTNLDHIVNLIGYQLLDIAKELYPLAVVGDKFKKSKNK